MTFFNGMKEDLQGGPRSTRTTSARGRRTTTTRSAGRTRCAPRSSGPSRSPATTAARATAWSSPGRPGSRPRATSARSGTTSSTSCPTILEATALAQPSSVNGVTQKPIEGVSMAYTFADAKAPSTRHTQYFEMFGNRAIYHDGWVACTTPPTPLGRPGGRRSEDVITGYKWELYDVDAGLQRGRQPGRQEPGQAEGTAAALLRRGRQVQRAAARQQQDHPARVPASARA